MLIKKREPWEDRALCKGTDPNFFFPTGITGRRANGLPRYGLEEAQQEVVDTICSRCDVQIDCINFAVANSLNHGVYGSTESQRAAIRRNRRKQNKVS